MSLIQHEPPCYISLCESRNKGDLFKFCKWTALLVRTENRCHCVYFSLDSFQNISEPFSKTFFLQSLMNMPLFYHLLQLFKLLEFERHLQSVLKARENVAMDEDDNGLFLLSLYKTILYLCGNKKMKCSVSQEQSQNLSNSFYSDNGGCYSMLIILRSQKNLPLTSAPKKANCS